MSCGDQDYTCGCGVDCEKADVQYVQTDPAAQLAAIAAQLERLNTNLEKLLVSDTYSGKTGVSVKIDASNAFREMLRMLLKK
jgi:hypothetical protein